MADMKEMVTNAEVEQFKRDRMATTEFLRQLQVLVSEFGAKVTPRNTVYRSMVRFLKGNV